MNKTFRLIWNTAFARWDVTSELTRARGKRSSSAAVKTIAAATLLTAGAVHAQLPTGSQVIAGEGDIRQDGNSLIIEQQSHRLAIEGQSFSIGRDNTVQFIQPDRTASALYRVMGADVSRIQGSLIANGQVFLINPNGILFTDTAHVDVGALIASTLDVDTEAFMNGDLKLEFSGNSSNAVINQGRIKADQGTVAMIAARIENTGSIETPRGSTLMGAGSKVVLDLGGSVSIEVEEGAIDALIEQGGAISADGGLVYLTASAANQLVTTVINHTGVTQAQSMANGQNGEIILKGDMPDSRVEVAGALDVSAPNGGNGGLIAIEADHIHLAETANIDARGTTGGGNILVGGDWQGGANPDYRVFNDPNAMGEALQVSMAPGAIIDASATDKGDGGTIVLWSDITHTGATTDVKGTLLARGGPNGGDGGLIETSGNILITEGARVRADAPGGGRGGLWFLDPEYSLITQGTADGFADTLNTGTNVTHLVSGDLIWDTGVTLTKTEGGDATLTLTTTDAGDITFRANARIESTSGTLDVVLNADGRIEIASSASFITNGGSTRFNASGNEKPEIEPEPEEQGIELEIEPETETQTETLDETLAETEAVVAPRPTVRFAGRVDASSSDTGGNVEITGREIVLDTGAELLASGDQAGGRIALDAGEGGQISVDAKLDVSSAQGEGGQVIIEAEEITLKENTEVDATGKDGGGDILVGGDWQGGANEERRVFDDPNAIKQAATVTMQAGASIDASATDNGDGGTIVLWSNINQADATTEVAGSLIARGGENGGDGGQIETSGAALRVNDVHIDTRAPQGQTGTWLLDPTDIFIVKGNSGSFSGDPSTTNSSNVGADTLSTQLASTNVIVETADGGSGNGDIFVNDAISWSSGNTLTLNAIRNIEINSAIDARQGDGGKLVLEYGQGSANGTIDGQQAYYLINAPVSLQASGESNGNNASPTNFTTQLGSDGTPIHFTTITNTEGADLNNQLENNLNGNFALSTNISLTGTDNWTPVSSYTGHFDGLGHTISNLIINRPSTDYVGLFGYTEGATISNLGLVNANVLGNNRVGGLVGYANNTTLENVYVTGSIEGKKSDGYTQAGGLVGYLDKSSISKSYSSADVTGGHGSLGGLVGVSRYASSTIEDSYATGSVTSTGNQVYVGGLVGALGDTTVNRTYATGLVTSSAGSNVGGLIGGYLGTESNSPVTNSYWDMQTTGQDTSFGKGATGKTTTEMTLASTFAGWENGDWTLAEGATVEGYGTLRPYLTNVTRVEDRDTASTLFNSGWGNTDGSGAYTITNWNQLQNMRHVLDVDFSFELSNNLTDETDGYGELGDDWTPIGDDANPFIGHFDGLDKTISELIIPVFDIDSSNNISGIATSSDNVGLFGKTFNSTVQNLNIQDADVGSSGQNIGILIGKAENTTVENVNIEGIVWGHRANSYNASTKDYTLFTDQKARVGGLIGYTNNSTITNVTVDADVYGDAFDESGDLVADGIGGLIGEASGTSISNASSTGLVLGRDLVGGLVGYTKDNTNIDDSIISDMSVTGRRSVGGAVGFSDTAPVNLENVGVLNTQVTASDSDQDGSGYSDVGGLIGSAINTTIIKSVASGVTVKGAGRNIGGAIGYLSGESTLTESYVTGSVAMTGTGTQGGVGGLVGSAVSNSAATVDNNDTIKIVDSYTLANVSVPSGANTTGGRGVGGLIGYKDNEIVVERAYAAGVIDGQNANQTAGFIGTSSDSTTTDDVWFDKTINPGLSDEATFGKTSAALRDPDLITSWAKWTRVSDAGSGAAVAGYQVTGPRLPYLISVTRVEDQDDPGTVLLFAGGWGGQTSEDQTGADGSPYLISDWNQLQHINQVAGDGYDFKLSGDLSLSGTGYSTQVKNGASLANDGKGWTPIGDATTPFKGSFDGGGNTISDLVLNSTTDNTGLFGVIGNGSITELTLTNASLTTSESEAGILAGQILLSHEASVVIDAIVLNTPTITSTDTGNAYVGGLIGSINIENTSELDTAEVTITDIEITDLTIDSKGERIGGLVGRMVAHDDSKLDIAIENVLLTSPEINAEDDYVGGIAGEARNRGEGQTTMRQLSVRGGVIDAGTGKYVGGLVGRLRNNSLLDQRNVFIGSVAGGHSVGGMTGRLSSNSVVNFGYVQANVTGSDTSSSQARAGLISGYTSRNDQVVTEIYAVGSVSHTDNARTDLGVIGRVGSAGDLYEDIYYHVTNGALNFIGSQAGAPTVNNVTELTAEQMQGAQARQNMVGVADTSRWNFDTNWLANVDEYPIFRWEAEQFNIPSQEAFLPDPTPEPTPEPTPPVVQPVPPSPEPPSLAPEPQPPAPNRVQDNAIASAQTAAQPPSNQPASNEAVIRMNPDSLRSSAAATNAQTSGDGAGGGEAATTDISISGGLVFVRTSTLGSDTEAGSADEAAGADSASPEVLTRVSSVDESGFVRVFAVDGGINVAPSVDGVVDATVIDDADTSQTEEAEPTQEDL